MISTKIDIKRLKEAIKGAGTIYLHVEADQDFDENGVWEVYSGSVEEEIMIDDLLLVFTARLNTTDLDRADDLEFEINIYDEEGQDVPFTNYEEIEELIYDNIKIVEP